ncbi:Gfo/Idh/MocA family oxidoreductase [Echinicola jeungdonensis]|uniref:Gfo/Idh/MocA family protein n=1 Tax=Echinicola jeungdonensis TaxID=709343 RepID=A0ABV5J462_9BACT|nr:Gfo/Idh/MocA family oxidoreductase [Echinicola jeungdonensis]MDN3667953.1 Gfo/Idh/MocA family oxidoreductase [Echinicola jeungdonensis]
MERRQFIQSALFATSALTLPVFSYGKTFGRIQRKLGVALVGLGSYSTYQLAPALEMTKHCYLAGIVTGTPSKAQVWQKKYGIPDANIYNYENFKNIADNPDIDVVYVVLPNSMHAEFSVKAAYAGKHVWCEKPMALNVQECEEIIEACALNRVKLCIGYRMQHEPNTRQIREFVRNDNYGSLQVIDASAGYFDGRSGHWRLDKSMGGGAMYDMGVYPINNARFISGQEPVSVMAYKSAFRPNKFHEVDETMNFILEFPNGLMANCATSLGINYNRFFLTCSRGHIRLEPFQFYRGLKGSTSDGVQFRDQVQSQQAFQMDHDAMAILENRPVMVPGEEGLKDIKVVEAAFQSAEKGIRVKI